VSRAILCAALGGDQPQDQEAQTTKASFAATTGLGEGKPAMAHHNRGS